jgi:hypothetical protein
MPTFISVVACPAFAFMPAASLQQGAEKRVPGSVAAILYRHNGNGINPALAT